MVEYLAVVLDVVEVRFDKWQMEVFHNWQVAFYARGVPVVVAADAWDSLVRQADHKLAVCKLVDHKLAVCKLVVHKLVDYRLVVHDLVALEVETVRLVVNSSEDILEPAFHEPLELVVPEAGTQIAAIVDTLSSAAVLEVQLQLLVEGILELKRASGQELLTSTGEKKIEVAVGVETEIEVEVFEIGVEVEAVVETVVEVSTVAHAILALDKVALHQPGMKVDSATCLVK